MAKKLLIINTGGTIGMYQTSNGWAPKKGFLQELMNKEASFQNDIMPSYDIYELDPLLDSSDMVPADWVRIAQVIEKNYADYEGFIIVHGTDTMAYTASALSFILENLDKSVILTGSQIPMMKPRNDGMENLVGAMLFAADYHIPEVCIYFDNILLRGNRSQKVNAEGFRAFESPNLLPLGIGGIHIKLNQQLILAASDNTAKLSVQSELDTHVGILWLFPGITGDVVRNYLKSPLKAMIVQAYGSGNGPVSNEAFISALKEANDRGVVLVDCTQCSVGSVALNDYASATGMAKTGIISGYDMTPEAALTKLAYLFGKGFSSEEVKIKVQESLRGELTTRINEI